MIGKAWLGILCGGLLLVAPVVARADAGGGGWRAIAIGMAQEAPNHKRAGGYGRASLSQSRSTRSH
jgi:hypothetical protein